LYPCGGPLHPLGIARNGRYDLLFFYFINLIDVVLYSLVYIHEVHDSECIDL
jgi:hypothetical protein